MGKGDRKTKKGKIFRSSFGKSRPKKARNKVGAEIIVNPTSKAKSKKKEKEEE